MLRWRRSQGGNCDLSNKIAQYMKYTEIVYKASFIIFGRLRKANLFLNILYLYISIYMYVHMSMTEEYKYTACLGLTMPTYFWGQFYTHILIDGF